MLLPSILTVFTNFFFGILLLLQARQIGGSAQGIASGLAQAPNELLRHGQAGAMAGLTSVNGPMDQGGFGAMAGVLTNDTSITIACIVAVWWLTNRFLEGVTTALVYSHLTEGPGSGKFSTACKAVLTSLPAIVVLGLVTLIAKKIASWMRNKRGAGVFGIGVNFLASIIEIFWTLAGHLILPAIVIEGSSFWGAMKRADRIAQGNLLTIGIGEVGVDAICHVVSFLVYAAGVAFFGSAWYLASQSLPIAMPIMIVGGLFWGALVVAVTAMSLYIRAAFYTCLYVWAIEAEAVEEADRHQITAPAPLAHALA